MTQKFKQNGFIPRENENGGANGKSGGKGGQKGSGQKNQGGQGSTGAKSGKKFCGYCRTPGHTKEECRSLARKNAKKAEQNGKCVFCVYSLFKTN